MSSLQKEKGEKIILIKFKEKEYIVCPLHFEIDILDPVLQEFPKIIDKKNYEGWPS